MNKIIVTLGPTAHEPRVLEAYLSIAQALRLNASHLSLAELNHWLQRLDHYWKLEGQSKEVIVDLQGSKMRLGHLPALQTLPDHVEAFLGQSSNHGGRWPIPHPELFCTVTPGERLSANDHRVLLEVQAVKEDWMKLKVLKKGPISSRKGINRMDHPVEVQSLSSQDQAYLRTAREYSWTSFAYSFVHRGEEGQWLQAFAPNHRKIAKIERAEAMTHLQNIDQHFDELWFCRGDMGAQVGLRQLGQYQDQFEQRLGKSLQDKGILAGQVLHHLTEHPMPTRTEVVHLWHLKKKGWKGIVMSDESAIGRYPFELVRWLKELCWD